MYTYVCVYGFMFDVYEFLCGKSVMCTFVCLGGSDCFGVRCLCREGSSDISDLWHKEHFCTEHFINI